MLQTPSSYVHVGSCSCTRDMYMLLAGTERAPNQRNAGEDARGAGARPTFSRAQAQSHRYAANELLNMVKILTTAVDSGEDDPEEEQEDAQDPVQVAAAPGPTVHASGKLTRPPSKPANNAHSNFSHHSTARAEQPAPAAAVPAAGQPQAPSAAGEPVAVSAGLLEAALGMSPVYSAASAALGAVGQPGAASPDAQSNRKKHMKHAAPGHTAPRTEQAPPQAVNAQPSPSAHAAGVAKQPAAPVAMDAAALEAALGISSSAITGSAEQAPPDAPKGKHGKSKPAATAAGGASNPPEDRRGKSGPASGSAAPIETGPAADEAAKGQALATTSTNAPSKSKSAAGAAPSSKKLTPAPKGSAGRSQNACGAHFSIIRASSLIRHSEHGQARSRATWPGTTYSSRATHSKAKHAARTWNCCKAYCRI